MSDDTKNEGFADKEPLLHQLVYTFYTKDGVPPSLCDLRDGFAFQALLPPLIKLGYGYGSPIVLYPDRDNKPGDDVREAKHVAFLRSIDMLAMTTRPPLNDEQTKKRKLIIPSHYDLEDVLFDELRGSYFAHLDRTRVTLTKSVVKAWAAKQGKRVGDICGNFTFRQMNGAQVSPVASLKKNAKEVPVSLHTYKTVCFFVHLPTIGEHHCPFIASFGMGGMETLAWNHIVAKHHSDWLAKPCFVVAEITIPEIPRRPITLDYIDKIKVDILLQHDGPPPAPAKKKLPVNGVQTAVLT